MKMCICDEKEEVESRRLDRCMTMMCSIVPGAKPCRWRGQKRLCTRGNCRPQRRVECVRSWIGWMEERKHKRRKRKSVRYMLTNANNNSWWSDTDACAAFLFFPLSSFMRIIGGRRRKQERMRLTLRMRNFLLLDLSRLALLLLSEGEKKEEVFLPLLVQNRFSPLVKFEGCLFLLTFSCVSSSCPAFFLVLFSSSSSLRIIFCNAKNLGNSLRDHLVRCVSFLLCLLSLCVSEGKKEWKNSAGQKIKFRTRKNRPFCWRIRTSN